MFIPLIRFQPHQEGICLPLFTVQMPQKTFNRLGLGARAWELFLKHCMNIDFRNADLLNTFVDFNTYCQILTLGMRVYGAQRLISWYVEDTEPFHMGPVGMAASSAPTVGEGIEFWLQASTIIAPHLQVTTHETQRDFIAQFQVQHDMGYVNELYRELVLWVCRRKLLDLTAGQAEVRVRYAHNPLFALEWYREAFGTEPELGHSCPSVVIERRWLAVENEAYTPMLHQRALEEYRQLTENFQNHARVNHRVRSLLIGGSYSNDFYSLDQVAERLNMSPRTLTRRLTDECTSFREIQCEVRLELAKQQLQNTRLPIKAICCNAGFTNVSAFSRAFRKYTSLTPSDYRQQI